MADLIFSARFKIHTGIPDNPEAAELEQWITQIDGDIFAINFETEEEFLAGKVKFFFVDLETSNMYPFYVLDARHETTAYIDALYGFEKDFCGFNQNTCNILNYDNWNPNLLVLDRIEILPVARGRGLTEMVINEACRLFSGKADVLALNVFPLQHEAAGAVCKAENWKASMNINEFEQDVEKAKENLASYYEKLGFEHILVDSDSHVMAKLIQHPSAN
jgi:GNAT superfamily N-acetyltransferase